MQWNTALLSNCGLTGDATTRFPVLGLGVERRSDGVHSADVERVGLPYSSLLSGSELCVNCVPFVLGPHDELLHHFTVNLPTCKAKANEGVFAAEEPSHSPRIIRFFE